MDDIGGGLCASMQSALLDESSPLRPLSFCLGSFGRSGEGTTIEDVSICRSAVVLMGIYFGKRDENCGKRDEDTVLCS